jgi:hypothetical protein
VDRNATENAGSSGSFRLLFREGKELGPVGFRPPGAPSKNPATAHKAEKKKRGARTIRKGDVPAGNLFDNISACVRHEAVYSRR